MSTQAILQPKRPKRTALLVGDFDGSELSHFRTEIRRRYDLGFVHRKSTDKIRDKDAELTGAFVMVSYYDVEYLNQLQIFCKNNGPLFIYAFDYDFSEQKAKHCLTLPYIKYRRYNRNPETVISVFGEFAADIREIDSISDKALSHKHAEYSALGCRIENAALAIRSLGLNSTSDIIAELEDIASALSDENSVRPRQKFDPRHEAKRALYILSKLFDHIENSRMASIIISGAVTSVVADVGWSGVACQTVCLASWHGKDAFMKAIDRLPSFAGPRSKKIEK
ncbi:hypothetical protein [Methylobacterium sp. CCH5-D2]|uniref:hypothetical protein n=1 Tax=Methylobacterium sp. CCH5-D2 TaxID=1768765 RepID=UPI000B169495|nr:hypothetical protein [Methylobacterium sp. CCH5-D2]